MRILTIIRYQGIDFRRNLTQIGMPLMMLGMTAFFATMTRQRLLSDESLGHLISIALTIATMLPVAMLTAMSIGEEKERRTLEALLLTPIKPWELILARLLSSLILATVTFGLAVLLFWRPIAAPGVLLLYFLLGAGWSMTTGLLVGVIAPDQRTTTGIMSVVVTVPFSLMGAPWADVAPTVWSVLLWTPYRPVLDLARMGMMGGNGWVQPALILTGWLAVTLLLTINQIKKRGFVR